MDDKPVPFSELLAGYGTTTIGDGVQVESVFAFLKLRAEDGSAGWAWRAGGLPMSKEELLGVLDGLTSSIREKLVGSWSSVARSPGAERPHTPPEPVGFGELLEGLETVGLADDQLIESVFALIKSRTPDRYPVWHVRSSEMTLSFQELLGALEGYAAAVRHDLSASWNW